MKRMILGLGVLAFLSFTNAEANVEQIKIYKEAYPDAKPKCIDCHVDKVPKKDDGLHALNDYGNKVLGLCPAPTADTYKDAGPIEIKE